MCFAISAREMAPAAAKQPLLSPRRAQSGSMFSEHQGSPLHDLSPIAQPGIASRVSRDFRVGTSLGSLGDALLEPRVAPLCPY